MHKYLRHFAIVIITSLEIPQNKIDRPIHGIGPSIHCFIGSYGFMFMTFLVDNWLIVAKHIARDIAAIYIQNKKQKPRFRA